MQHGATRNSRTACPFAKVKQSGPSAPGNGPTNASDMTDPSTDPDIYRLVFDQTPKVIQWLLGVLTLGLFTIAAWAWRAQTSNVQRVERQVHRRMDRFEENTNKRMDDTNKRMDEMNHHLIEIAQNTRRQ